MAIRVLQIVTYMGRGGLETMLMNYYRHIDRTKVQFDFLVHRNFIADYDREILDLGGKIYHMPRLIPWSSLYKIKLKNFLKDHQEYKIIHVHQDCLSSVALQCAKECNIPVRIAHSHNSSQTLNFKYIIKQYYMKKIPTFATALFSCGKQAGDWMFSNHPYQILPNAIDISKYEYSKNKSEIIRNKLGINSEIVIGHVGRFDLQKNHIFLIEIFNEFVKIVPNAKLLLVGDGKDRMKIEKKVKSLGLVDNVVFMGVRNDVNDIFQAMDIFVFPSLYEGLPVTMIEAQAAGLPCVISDHVPKECIITTGLVTVKKLSDTPKEWAQYILKKLKAKRENHLKEIQQAGYDINIAAHKLEQYYLMKYGEQ
mgnify:CR=1 FL=1